MKMCYKHYLEKGGKPSPLVAFAKSKSGDKAAAKAPAKKAPAKKAAVKKAAVKKAPPKKTITRKKK